MLSSTANNLFWMGRYIERAENTARLLTASSRMSLIDGTASEWRSVAAIYGIDMAPIIDRGPTPDEALLNSLCFDLDNPSSILGCFRLARNNARAERNNLTVEAWENINGTWLELSEISKKGVGDGDYRSFFDYVKRQVHLILGSIWTTMLRDEAFDFLNVGIFIERADNTARILDVKYHNILPDGAPTAEVIDYYEWAELLACVSAVRAYKRVYQTGIEPRLVAELLILRQDLPRSLHYCLRRLEEHLGSLAEAHGQRHECHRLCGLIHARLRYGTIDQVFKRGLHWVMDDFTQRIAGLSDEIGRDYLMTV